MNMRLLFGLLILLISAQACFGSEKNAAQKPLSAQETYEKLLELRIELEILIKSNKQDAELPEQTKTKIEEKLQALGIKSEQAEQKDQDDTNNLVGTIKKHEAIAKEAYKNELKKHLLLEESLVTVVPRMAWAKNKVATTCTGLALTWIFWTLKSELKEQSHKGTQVVVFAARKQCSTLLTWLAQKINPELNTFHPIDVAQPFSNLPVSAQTTTVTNAIHKNLTPCPQTLP
jgi:hypothetical protein